MGKLYTPFGCGRLRLWPRARRVGLACDVAVPSTALAVLKGSAPQELCGELWVVFQRQRAAQAVGRRERGPLAGMQPADGLALSGSNCMVDGVQALSAAGKAAGCAKPFLAVPRVLLARCTLPDTARQWQTLHSATAAATIPAARAFSTLPIVTGSWAGRRAAESWTPTAPPSLTAAPAPMAAPTATRPLVEHVSAMTGAATGMPACWAARGWSLGRGGPPCAARSGRRRKTSSVLAQLLPAAAQQHLRYASFLCCSFAGRGRPLGRSSCGGCSPC